MFPMGRAFYDERYNLIDVPKTETYTEPKPEPKKKAAPKKKKTPAKKKEVKQSGGNNKSNS